MTTPAAPWTPKLAPRTAAGELALTIETLDERAARLDRTADEHRISADQYAASAAETRRLAAEYRTLLQHAEGASS